MSQIQVYLNGEYLPLEQAKISVLDRGFIFGDGVYEVIPAYHRQLFRIEHHLQRLQQSLDGIRINNPLSPEQWQEVLTRIVELNPGEDQSIYLQITRGIAQRDHAFPQGTSPSVFVMSTPLLTTSPEKFQHGVATVTLDDIRWQYCHIKAIALLPNILLRQQALDQGAAEAILVRNGYVTEGAASNIFMVKDGTVFTPPNSPRLLPGITRDLVVELCQQHAIPCHEENFTLEQMLQADEAWLTSSTKELLPVIKIDDTVIGTGQPGPLCHKLFTLFQEYKLSLKPH